MAYVLGLGIAEAPYLVTLNPAGWNVSNGFVVVVRAGFPGLHQQPGSQCSGTRR